KLEKHRGHLYNWYDIKRLEALEPRYVSTVDSGNLAGHLIALQHACGERIDAPAIEGHALAGVSDALALVRESLSATRSGAPPALVTRREIEAAGADVEELLSPLPENPAQWGSRLAARRGRAEVLADAAEAFAHEETAAAYAEVRFWAKATLASIGSHERDFGAVLSWCGDPY